MKQRLTGDAPHRTYSVVLDKGEEFVVALQRFVNEQGLSAGRLSGHGAFSYVVLGVFDWATRDYKRIHIDQQVEVVSLIGDVTASGEGGPGVQTHVAVARPDGSVCGGYLLEGYVRPALQVVLEEATAGPVRRRAFETSLALNGR